MTQEGLSKLKEIVANGNELVCEIKNGKRIIRNINSNDHFSIGSNKIHSSIPFFLNETENKNLRTVVNAMLESFIKEREQQLENLSL